MHVLPFDVRFHLGVSVERVGRLLSEIIFSLLILCCVRKAGHRERSPGWKQLLSASRSSSIQLRLYDHRAVLAGGEEGRTKSLLFSFAQI